MSEHMGHGGRKRLSLTQMLLLTHLKAGVEKGANRRCDCDGYRPDTLGGAIEQAESVTSNRPA